MRNPVNIIMLTAAFVCLLIGLANNNDLLTGLSSVTCIFWMVQIWTR